MRLSLLRPRRATLVPLLVLGFALPCSATTLDWHLFGSGKEDMEFRINASIGGSPSALETGYNGAYNVWVLPDYFSTEAQGWGESFSVASDRTLLSADLKITTNSGSTGDFEVAVYEFDVSTLALGTKLASSVKDVADYVGDLAAAPVSNFDLSFAGANLSAGLTYLLTVAPLAGFEGQLYSHAATDIYGGGSSYFGTVVAVLTVPEPATAVLVLVGVGAVALLRRAQKTP